MVIMKRSPRETAREYAYRVIKHNIVSLELKPGSMLSEKEIADELNVSRTPVREALIELSKINIVEIYPQKGSFIAKIDHELVEEARDLRLIVECALVEKACDIATSEDIFRLEENIKLQEFYINQDGNDKNLELDDEFHQLLYRICNKNMTYQLISNMLIHFDRVRKLSIVTIKDTKIIMDHKQLVEAIKDRDRIRSKEIIIKHLNRYEVDKEELTMKYPEYFI